MKQDLVSCSKGDAHESEPILAVHNCKLKSERGISIEERVKRGSLEMRFWLTP
jgi:hypothetical protein